MEIYIVRHGETFWNEKKLLQGSTDIELNENGKKLAVLTGEALKDTRIDRIYASPLKRAYETACLIRGDRDIPIIKNDLIREMNFGDYEGQNASELLRTKAGLSNISSRDRSYILLQPMERLWNTCVKEQESSWKRL